jgi:hypothetical protein
VPPEAEGGRLAHDAATGEVKANEGQLNNNPEVHLISHASPRGVERPINLCSSLSFSSSQRLVNNVITADIVFPKSRV